jgi:hypothetical protein
MSKIYNQFVLDNQDTIISKEKFDWLIDNSNLVKRKNDYKLLKLLVFNKNHKPRLEQLFKLSKNTKYISNELFTGDDIINYLKNNVEIDEYVYIYLPHTSYSSEIIDILLEDRFMKSNERVLEHMSRINNITFNSDTIDKLLDYLLENNIIYDIKCLYNNVKKMSYSQYKKYLLVAKFSHMGYNTMEHTIEYGFNKFPENKKEIYEILMDNMLNKSNSDLIGLNGWYQIMMKIDDKFCERILPLIDYSNMNALSDIYLEMPTIKIHKILMESKRLPRILENWFTITNKIIYNKEIDEELSLKFKEYIDGEYRKLTYSNEYIKVIILKLLILLFNTCSPYKLSIETYIEKFVGDYENICEEAKKKYSNKYNNYLKYFVN